MNLIYNDLKLSLNVVCVLLNYNSAISCTLNLYFKNSTNIVFFSEMCGWPKKMSNVWNYTHADD